MAGTVVDEVFVFVSQEETGEMVPGFKGPNGEVLPMIAFDREGLDRLLSIVGPIADQSGKVITLLRFSDREMIGDFRKSATSEPEA